MRKISDARDNKGWVGLPGWPEAKICRHPEHDPPGHIVLEPGTYEHTCPGCGRVQIVNVPVTTWLGDNKNA